MPEVVIRMAQIRRSSEDGPEVVHEVALIHLVGILDDVWDIPSHRRAHVRSLMNPAAHSKYPS